MSAPADTDPALASLPPAGANGARPGPAVLYAPEPSAPQLASFDPTAFRAAPLLVSGTEAYRSGEYLYQGYLYADHGAGTNSSGPGAYVGNLTYPTNTARYGNNAANLVEFRASTLEPGRVVYRFTLNTLLAPDTTIVTLAYDTDGNRSTGCSRLPHDPGAPFPGTDQVLTTWGTGADFAVCSGGSWRTVATAGSGLGLSENLAARQITVTVPRSVSDPHGVWRATLAVGLYDGKGGWLMPGANATPTQPGGGPANGIFDLGFRFGEPVSSQATLPLFSGVGPSPDGEQAAALAADDPIALQHPIDFGGLDRGIDASSVPPTGNQVRIFPSRVHTGEGIDDGGHIVGQLQPYTLMVPATYRPGRRLGITLALHSLGDHYWQYTLSDGMRSWSDGHHAFVASPEARGTDLWYHGVAELDVFEMWNDVARHFDLDPSKAAILGYSMGGYGTQWLSSLYPDLFGKAVSMVGGPNMATGWIPPVREGSDWNQNVEVWLENFRNLPIMKVYAQEDELAAVNYGPGDYIEHLENFGVPGPFGYKGLDPMGYQYASVDYLVAEHLTVAGGGYDVPPADGWLDDISVPRHPAHVTFSFVPGTDDPALASLGLVHDHAYWISGVTLASDRPAPSAFGGAADSATSGWTTDPGSVPKATVDAVSGALGPASHPTHRGADAGVGPSVLPWTEYYQLWDPAPTPPPTNSLSLTLTNVAQCHVDLVGAGLDTNRGLDLSVSTSTATVLYLDGTFGPSHVLVDGREAPATRTPTGLRVALPAGSHRVEVGP
ncbi:MAG TPA: alpha/beta hydrolase-fold protein [Acidimicrobiales bacterium]|nr:alpha/beta hydrolase-fold protein [Acidimicrobiales bacterium]